MALTLRCVVAVVAVSIHLGPQIRETVYLLPLLSLVVKVFGRVGARSRRPLP
jgi:hypothetical protein